MHTLKLEPSGKLSRRVDNSHLTIWDHDLLQWVRGVELESLLGYILTSLAKHITNDGAAVYLLEKGRLSLLVSLDVDEIPPYQTCVAVPPGLADVGADLFHEIEIFAQNFVLDPPTGSPVIFPLYQEDQLKGVLLMLCTTATLKQTDIENIRSRIGNLASILSTVEILQREKRRSHRLSMINRICQRIDEFVAADQLYERIVTYIQKGFEYDHVAIYLVDKKSNSFKLRGMAGKYSDIIPKDQSIPFGQGIISWVASHGKTFLSNNVHRSPQFLNWTPELIPTQAELCAPIRVDKEVIGVLNIESAELLSFDKDDVNAIEVLTDRIAVAIKNSRHYAGLREGYKRLDGIVSSMGHGLLIIDERFVVQWVNKTLVRWGFDNELIGEDCHHFLNIDGSSCKNCPPHLTFQSGEIHRDVIRSRKDRYYGITSAPITDVKTRITHVVVVVDDITTSVRTQNELEQLKCELEHSRRLASVGEIAASIAHEIRNPLNAMSQAAELLEVDLKGSDEQRQLLKVFKEECFRVNESISTYLSLCHGNKRDLGLWDIETSIRQVVTLLRADCSISRRVDFNIDVPAQLPLIYLDPNALKQMFWNLFLNAVEAIDKKGLIEISATYDGGQIQIVIKDSGNGIRKRELKKIFQPYYTNKAVGTGLGLAIVKRIVEDHGWVIGVESKLNRGTRFIITIPQQV